MALRAVGLDVEGALVTRMARLSADTVEELQTRQWGWWP